MTEQNTIYNNMESEEVIVEKLKQHKSDYETYLKMNQEWKQKFIDFCMGKKTLPLLYDSTFKLIFNPEIHPERLEGLISAILKQKVKVKELLLPEDSMLVGESVVIMDIIVELENGSIADVEIQKNPYMFTGERLSCYSSDILMRQYTRLKNKKGKDFQYGDLQKVYTIVIFEKSVGLVQAGCDQYIYHGTVKFDKEINLEMLQEYHIVALDVFRKNAYHKIEDSRDDVNGWLSLLVTEDMSDVEYVIERYPWLEVIYKEIAAFRGNVQGVMSMYSQMLRETDESTLRYLVDVYKEQLAEQQQALASKDEELASKDEELASKDKQLAKLRAEIESLKKN